MKRQSYMAKLTYQVKNLSTEKEAQDLVVQTIRGVYPTGFAQREPLNFYAIDFTFIGWYYYGFTFPAGLETATLEIEFGGILAALQTTQT